jgi:hypothetical protein
MVRTGAWDFGRPREDKQLGDVVLDANLGEGTELILRTFLNSDAVQNPDATLEAVAGRKRYTFDVFGSLPEAARNASFEFQWESPTNNRSLIHALGCAARVDPDTVFKRATAWEELPGGEGYLYGVRLVIDTRGQDVDFVIETTTVNGSATTVASITAVAAHRKILHFTWDAAYAQQVRLRPNADCAPFKLFRCEWIVDPEPPRIAGWNSNWHEHGILADKYLKGFVIHCDTFNVAKNWAIDVDGSNGVQTGSITQNGPGVQMISFARTRGRLFRFRGTDNNLGKLYKWQPIFDMEPLALTRWETMEVDHGYVGWQIPIDGFFTIRSSAEVTLAVTVLNQIGGTVNTRSYAISSTGGLKAPRYVQFNADKGCLFVYVLTSSAPFWLYREESEVRIQPFGGGEVLRARPFGNDDISVSRSMTTADITASQSGGSKIG